MALLALKRILRFQRSLKHSGPAPSWLHDEVARLSGLIGLKRSPAVRLVSETISPLLWSLGRRPQIILPVALLKRMDQQQREATLLHELFHLRRHDDWARFLELAAGSCYWWHPVVWWARREIQWSEDACCDAWVVWHSSKGGRSYASALLETIDFLSESRPVLPPLASGFGRFGALKRRLTMIMEGTTPPRLSGVGRLTVIIIAVCALPFWPSVGQEPAEEAESAMEAEELADDASGRPAYGDANAVRRAQPRPRTARPAWMPMAAEPTEFDKKARSLEPNVQRVRSLAFDRDGRRLAVAHGGSRTDGAVRVWDIQERKEIALWNEAKGICTVHISPDGCLVAFQSYTDKMIRVCSIESGEDVFKITTGGASARVRFSPDGKTLATASTDGALKLWDVKEGKELTSLASFTFNLQCVAFSRDGARIVAGGGPYGQDAFGQASVWEIASGKQIAEMKGMPESVLGIAISPDGKLVATAGRDSVARLWEAETGKLVSALYGHLSILEWVDFSPDGKLLATGSYDDTAKLWNVDSGREVATLPGHLGDVMSTRFSPDGKMLVTGDGEGMVRLWDVATRQQIDILQPGSDEGKVAEPVLAIAYSPKQALIASAHEDQTVRLSEPSTGRVVRVLTGHDDVVSCVAFFPDGRILATAGYDKKVKLWDVAEGKELKTFVVDTDGVFSATFSSDGKSFASFGGHDKAIRLWDIGSGAERAKLEGHSATVRCAAFSADGKRLASGSGDRTIKVWDTETFQDLVTLQGHTAGIQAVAFSPNGKTLASASEDKSVKLWDVASGNERVTLADHTVMVRCLAFSPRGRTLASGGFDSAIKLWDPETGGERLTLKGHEDVVTSLAFAPDTSALISGSYDKSIKLWPSQEPRIPPLATLRVTDGTLVCRFGVFSPDRRLIITGGDDKVIQVWDLQTGRVLRTLQNTRGSTCGALSPDGKLLATGTYGDPVLLWDVASGRRVGEIAVGEGRSLTVDFSPDGTRLAVSSWSGRVSVWDVKSRQKLWASEAQALPVACVVFSPDGKTVATTTGHWKKPDEAGEVKLWDADTGKELALFSGHSRKIRRVRFSPDGKLLVSGGADRTLRIWDIEARKLRSIIPIEHPVDSITFLPDRKSLGVSHFPGGVSLWDIDSQQRLAEYEGHGDTQSLFEVTCSPDGSLIASAGSDGTVRLWPTLYAKPDTQTAAERVRGWASGTLSKRSSP